MYDLTLKMTIFAIVLGKSKMCLQENLADCADCGGLMVVFLVRCLITGDGGIQV